MECLMRQLWYWALNSKTYTSKKGQYLIIDAGVYCFREKGWIFSPKKRSGIFYPRVVLALLTLPGAEIGWAVGPESDKGI